MASGDRPDTKRKPSGKKAENLSQEEQSERFKQTAQELGVDESGIAFEKAVERILPSPSGRTKAPAVDKS